MVTIFGHEIYLIDDFSTTRVNMTSGRIEIKSFALVVNPKKILDYTAYTGESEYSNAMECQ